VRWCASGPLFFVRYFVPIIYLLNLMAVLTKFGTMVCHCMLFFLFTRTQKTNGSRDLGGGSDIAATRCNVWKYKYITLGRKEEVLVDPPPIGSKTSWAYVQNFYSTAASNGSSSVYWRLGCSNTYELTNSILHISDQLQTWWRLPALRYNLRPVRQI
jgi:hypothetical protein